MNVDKRREIIIEHVNKRGKVTISEICDLFDVSEMTIRRDFRDLDKIGLLRRIHGGAVSGIGRSYEPAYTVRANDNYESKKAIGLKAAEYVHDGDSIFIDTGTTTIEFARALKNKRNLTIITSSIPVANEVITTFSLLNDVRLIMTGGVVRAVELSMIGEDCHATILKYHVDKAFLGVSGIDLEAGLTEYNVDDAWVIKTAMKSAQQRIVLADSSKLGRVTFSSVSKLTDFDILITDKGAPEDFLEELRKLNVEIEIAD